MALTNFVHCLILLQQCSHIEARRYGGGGSYHSGGSGGGSRGRIFPLWFPHRYGNRECADDGTECQESGSVILLDIVILVLVIIACLGCCFLCAARSQDGSTHHKTNSVSNEDCNPYVTMQDQQQGKSPTITTNQQYNPVVVQGVDVSSSIV